MSDLKLYSSSWISLICVLIGFVFPPLLVIGFFLAIASIIIIQIKRKEYKGTGYAVAALILSFLYYLFIWVSVLGPSGIKHIFG